ncbi:hypothetical protein SCAR479_13432 [Seiridium cardinale]|uniref:Uncharacterized protein n=1 Tax=Seiridium cardinale TaxID=138064 RepID=A0ABR2X801_9PEZI
MASDSRHDGLLTPAPYGKACLSCARAKCKCFYRPEGSLCERAPSPQHSRDLPAPPPPLVPASRLEDKLDDLVTLLRCQVEKQAQVSQPTPQLTLGTTPSSSGITTNPATTERHPEMLVDTVHNTVQLLRPSSPSPLRSPIMEDISLHHIPEAVADEQLATFCRAFLPIFPFVHIGVTMKSCELRNVKPFLWLNIMALATKSVSQQFAMEETIWQIISQRIVVQHFANIDLLLGVVCFASWSHYFKKDRPYMTMLAQIAVSLACELGINGDVSSFVIVPIGVHIRCQPHVVGKAFCPRSLKVIPHQANARQKIPTRANKRNRSQPNGSQQLKCRNLEERRSILAVFHLTSASWAAYRKTEPMRWTPYLDSSRGFNFERKWDDEIIFHYNSSIAQTTQRSSAESTGRSAHFSTELSIRESILRGGPDRLPGVDVQRLRELDSVLTAIEGWLDVFTHMPLVDAIGIHVDNFTQFLHCIVVLFKLSVLEEPGWDLEEVKRRLDVFNVLDTTYQLVESITIVTGMVDAEGPRSGLFFKAKHLWRAIKALLVAEYSESMVTSNLHGCQKEGGANEAATVAEDISMDNFLFNLADEPWLSDISNYDWGAAEVSNKEEGNIPCAAVPFCSSGPSSVRCQTIRAMAPSISILPNIGDRFGSAFICLAILVVVFAAYHTFFVIHYPSNLPLAGEPAGRRWFSLRTRWRYLTDCASLYREAYEKFAKHGKTVLVPGFGARHEIILPQSAMRWVFSQPDSALSLDHAFTEIDQIHYGLGNEMYILDPWQGNLVKTEMNAVLENICAAMNDELGTAFDTYFGVDTENWKEIDLISTVRMIVAQAASRFTVGLPF